MQPLHFISVTAKQICYGSSRPLIFFFFEFFLLWHLKHPHLASLDSPQFQLFTSTVDKIQNAASVFVLSLKSWMHFLRLWIFFFFGICVKKSLWHLKRTQIFVLTLHNFNFPMLLHHSKCYFSVRESQRHLKHVHRVLLGTLEFGLISTVFWSPW